jgi:hypothetical protein
MYELLRTLSPQMGLEDGSAFFREIAFRLIGEPINIVRTKRIHLPEAPHALPYAMDAIEDPAYLSKILSLMNTLGFALARCSARCRGVALEKFDGSLPRFPQVELVPPSCAKQ